DAVSWKGAILLWSRPLSSTNFLIMEPFRPSAIGTMMYFKLVAWQSVSRPLLFFLYTKWSS
ncbi:mCG1033044, partial [Mus musculus]